MTTRSTVAIIVLLFLCSSGAAQSEVAVAFGSDEISVSGLTPDGRVAFFAVARVKNGYMNQLESFREFLRADASGEARLALDRTIPQRSVWAVIDFQTGNRAVVSPAGFEARERHISLDRRGLIGPNGLPRLLRVKRQDLRLLVVRPGIGGWHARLSDGGASDFDEDPNGTLVAYAEDLTPIGRSPVLREFLPGDVVLALDPGTLEFFNAELVQ